MRAKFCVLVLATFIVTTFTEKHERKRRYLLFTPSTQWGVFITVSMPLHPETTVSVAWFLEANYYNVDNATYFEPLLGDIATLSRNKRSVSTQINGFTRSFMYTALEKLLQKPSTSMSEDALDDIYYEAEYLGMDGYCDHYADGCPTNPLDLMSVFIEKL
ncbi:uncharacterized protein LOC106143302 isoform X3 [Amyelois transitella]|uniref:uncharacterized protein LOC106143302 isoform X3 n=1 Tax=Amyelois transitella TaxID=680683 RepID=UPI00298F8BE5|nr:uncharacterized protein LOC106143302 isoform X3 [Amyelois transitella]